MAWLPLKAATVYVDFGPSSGDASREVNGDWWNAWTPGDDLNLEIDEGTDSGWNLISTTAAGAGTGFLGSYATFGAPTPFDDASIAGDALFLEPGDGVRNVRLTSLDPAKTYNFQIYGAREATTTRITDYEIVGANSGFGSLTTSGTDIGSTVGTETANYNNTSILAINGISPTSGGLITIEYSVDTGSFGYLNALTVTEVPEPTGLLIGSMVGLVMLRRRR